MIKGMHAMFYSSAPEAIRTFFRDKLGMAATDIGGGWLIFDIPEADLGFHPAGNDQGGSSGTAHISFYCDDIHETVDEMKSKGVEFNGDIEEHSYGFVTEFQAPGDFWIQLYQPKYNKEE